MKLSTLKKKIEKIKDELNLDKVEFEAASERHRARFHVHVFSKHVMTEEYKRAMDEIERMTALEFGIPQRKRDSSKGEKAMQSALALLKHDTPERWAEDQEVIERYHLARYGKLRPIWTDAWGRTPEEMLNHYHENVWGGFVKRVDASPELRAKSKLRLTDPRWKQERNRTEKSKGKPVEFGVAGFGLGTLVPIYADGSIGNPLVYHLSSDDLQELTADSSG